MGKRTITVIFKIEVDEEKQCADMNGDDGGWNAGLDEPWKPEGEWLDELLDQRIDDFAQTTLSEGWKITLLNKEYV